MSRFNLKDLTSHHGSPFLTWFHEASVEGMKMIRGIGGFIVTRIPELCREWLGDLHELAIFGCRAAFHVGKFTGVFVGWLGILLAPLIIYPGWITVVWLGIALWGSVWGLRHMKKKPSLLAPVKREARHA